ncbi:MAG: hypothetical protein ACRCV6_06690 [Formosimonas sp.]
MKNFALPLHKNPAWVRMGDYASFNDALSAMRYYDARYERWQALRTQMQRSLAAFFLR